MYQLKVFIIQNDAETIGYLVNSDAGEKGLDDGDSNSCVKSEQMLLKINSILLI